MEKVPKYDCLASAHARESRCASTTIGGKERARGARLTFDARRGTSSTQADPQPKTESCKSRADKPTIDRGWKTQLQYQLSNIKTIASVPIRQCLQSSDSPESMVIGQGETEGT